MSRLHRRYEDILRHAVAALKEVYGRRLVACAVYGSVGRGTMRFDSDVDLLIVARDLPEGRFERRREFEEIEARLAPLLTPMAPGYGRIDLSPVFRTPAELELGGRLYLDLTEDARIVHDPEGVLEGFLDRYRAKLAKLGARRIWRGNVWYWDLKPDFKPGDVIDL